jgi:hypothetical protein
MVGDAGQTSDSNTKKNNLSNTKSRFKWLRKLRTETYSPTETIISKEEISKIKAEWENVANKWATDPNSKRLCLSQMAKEMARRSKDTGSQWILTRNRYISDLSKEGIDKASAKQTLEIWKKVGELQRSKPHELTTEQKKALIIHLTKQEVLNKKLSQSSF